MRTQLVRGIVVASAVLLFGTACGSDDSSDSSANETQSSAQSPDASSGDQSGETPGEGKTPSEDESSSGGGEAPSGDITAPGAELSIGDTATVPFESAKKKGTVAVTLDESKKGSKADLKPFKLGDKVKGFTPYYLNFTIDGVAGSKGLEFTSISESLEGVLGDGSKATVLGVIGDFKPCETNSFPADFAKGDSYQTCVVYLAGQGAEVTAGQYGPSDSKYDDFDGKPVIWK